MSELITRLRAAWDNLADRERLLVGSALGLLALGLIWLLAVRPVVAQRQRVRERVAAAEQQLERMGRLRAEFAEVNQRLGAVERRIQSGRRGNLRTTLENLAQQTGVKIESMEPQSSPANERYRETKVEVGLKGVTLPQTVNYLHRIESNGEVLSVKTLRIRTRNDKPDLLDVTFTVSSFEAL